MLFGLTDLLIIVIVFVHILGCKGKIRSDSYEASDCILNLVIIIKFLVIDRRRASLVNPTVSIFYVSNISLKIKV